MPVTTTPILSIATTDQSSQVTDILQIAKVVAAGAFSEATNFRIEQSNEASGQSFLMLTTEALIDHKTLIEVAARLAESIIQLIALVARDLQITVRQRYHPIYNRLKLPGLTWHFVRHRLIKMNAVAASSPITIRLACEITTSTIQITFGQPTVNEIRAAYLCTSIIHVRVTPLGKVVRIRCSNREMSITIPNNIGSSAISNGMTIRTKPVVGLVQHRMIGTQVCQLPLL